MASIGDNRESDPPCKRRNTKEMPPLDELAKKKELHHLIPAALSGSDINARYNHKKTLLHLVLESGCSLETLNVLKEAGADTKARDMFGYNALYFAVKGNCSDEVINELLEYNWGMFFQKNSYRYETFLRLAAENKRLHLFVPVIVKHQKIDYRYSYDWTLLHLALRYDCLRSVETILQYMSPSSLNETDDDGDTSLHRAARWGCSPLKIRALVNAGLNPATTNKYGKNALHCAMSLGRPWSVDTILQFMSFHEFMSSSLNEADDDGNTYLHCAAQAECGPRILRDLLNAGLNPATKSKFGDTALHLAISTGCPQSIDTILQFMSTSSLNETNDDGDTYLHFAVRMHCRFEEVCALLNAGVNPSTKNYVGENALHVLISKKWHGSGDFEGILKELLRGHPELIEERNRCLKFPIDEAPFTDINGRTILKYVLLQNGADFQWSRISNEPSHHSFVSAKFFNDCRSDLELLRAFMVTDTMSLGDLVKACYVSPNFFNELRVEKRFVRVLQFEEKLTIYEEEVRDIVRMVRVCSSLYGKTLPFPVFKNGSYVNVSQKVLDYLSVDDLEKLNIATN